MTTLLTMKGFDANGWIMDNRTLAQTSNSLGGFYTGVFAKKNGTKIFFCDAAVQRVYECTLTTPYDISSLSLSKYISCAYPEDISFSKDGTKMFILKSDSSPYQVIRYTLSTAWDISTATQDQAITAGTANGDRGMYITPDGDTNLYWYELSTPYNLSTITNSGTKNIGKEKALGIWFNSMGTIAFTSTNDGYIRKYTL